MFFTTVILVLIFLVTFTRCLNKKSYRICESVRRLQGKTALVTGGTSGIGLEIAKNFATRGARVIIACPFKEEGITAKQKIIEETKNNNIVFKLLDLASLASVRNFAEDIKNTEDRLDILVNNAGIGNCPDILTPDGINLLLQVNYFGHFLLTVLLLPLLKKSGSADDPARVINTSSIFRWNGSYELVKVQRGDQIFINKHRRYPTSKLCMAWFSKDLAKRLANTNVVTNSVDPGASATTIFYCNGPVLGFLTVKILGFFFKSPWEGAQTTIHAAVDRKAGRVNGKFFRNCQVVDDVSRLNDKEAEARLWDDSVRLVKLSKQELDEVFCED